ncbi:MAG: class I SAM-dependent methyltransferase [Kiritimatiellae bacterium]|nr:class I SAM-dependent methyltransferase [Kiritimatiellia bacterium]
MRFSRKQIMENDARLKERDRLYRRHGYDSRKAARFVLACAGPLAGRILEIGTGKGRFLVELARRRSNVVTVDPDAAEQRFARLNAAHAGVTSNIRFVVADGAHLPFADVSFDAVVSMNALHHIRDLNGVLDEVLRVVKPGGKIVLADFDANGFRLFDRIHRQEQRTHERRRYYFKNLVTFLAAQDCFALRFQGDGQEVLVASKSRRKRARARHRSPPKAGEEKSAAERREVGERGAKDGRVDACRSSRGPFRTA